MRFATLLAVAAGAAAALVDNGTVLTMNGIPLYAGGISVGHLDSQFTGAEKASLVLGSGLIPFTIVETDSSSFDATELKNITDTYKESDDVFQDGFAGTVLVKAAGVNQTIAGDTFAGETTLIAAAGGFSGNATGFSTGSLTPSLPVGPYFLSAGTGNIYKAFRIYPDDNLAFIQAVISDEADGFVSLPALTENVMAKSAAVPSRLYYTPTEEKPLAGLRFGVKDIFDIKGVGTSAGNRAYYYFYGTQNATASSIQRLVDLGAVLIGKLGTVQFVDGDTPTADWVDLHCPFNPRGDGYQSPSGSSTGPGAAIASYDWMDFAIGSDTGGSMRFPASVEGVFGNRPSTGAIALDHVLPLSPVSDTVGCFAHSAHVWAKVTQAWYTEMPTNYTTYPKSLVVAADAELVGPVGEVVHGFYNKLAGFLNTSAETVNYTAKWETTHPEGFSPVIDENYVRTYAVYVGHDQYQMVGRPFVEAYAAEHDGRVPYIHQGIWNRWNYARFNRTEQDYQTALTNISTFEDWWTTEGWGQSDPETCSRHLYAYVASYGTPNYRDVYRAAPPSPPTWGLSDNVVSMFAREPELIVPVGEVAYNSTKTLHEEYLPVTVGLRMARGCDYYMAELVRDMEDAGVVTPVLTGSRLYE